MIRLLASAAESGRAAKEDVLLLGGEFSVEPVSSGGR